jgi:hypothetical protein
VKRLVYSYINVASETFRSMDVAAWRIEMSTFETLTLISRFRGDFFY